MRSLGKARSLKTENLQRSQEAIIGLQNQRPLDPEQVI